MISDNEKKSLGGDTLYYLFVSYDRGKTYEVEESSEDVDHLKQRSKAFDFSGWRWIIEDEGGEFIDMCEILKKLKKNMRPVKGATLVNENTKSS